MKTILIVDDSATMRKIIKRVLRQAELSYDNVLEASNGVEALEHIGSDDSIDLILSDVNMPEMNGIELVGKVRESHTADAIKIMMVTTEGGEDMRNQALAAGANGYVTKPFTPETVREAVERIAA